MQKRKIFSEKKQIQNIIKGEVCRYAIFTIIKDKPEKELCKLFNEETKDGKQMQRYSNLLQDAIRSIIEVKEERDVMSLFSAGETTALLGDVQGLDDFELICFLVIR